MWKFDYFIALTFIFIVIYGRIFRKIHEINLYSENLIVYTYFVLLSFFMSMILFITYLFLLYKQYHVSEKSKIIIILTKYLIKYFSSLDRGLLYIYTKIYDFFTPNKTQYVIKLAKWFTNSKKIYFIFFFVSTIPYVIIILVLLVEIYLGNLKYYFYCMFLLIIPIILQILFYMLKDIGPRLSKEFENLMVWDNVHSKVKMKKAYDYIPLEYYLSNYYLPIIKIEKFIKEEFLPKYQKFRTLTFVIYYFILTLCWGYILIYFVKFTVF